MTKTKKIKLECNGNPDKEFNDRFVIGIDEAGKGPIAGPMYVGIVTFMPMFLCDYEDDVKSMGLKDSKVLSEKKRREIGSLLKTGSKSTVIEIPAKEIDAAVNINDLFDKYTAAGLRKFLNAYNGFVGKKLEKFLKERCMVLMDGNRKIKGIPLDVQVARPKLDATSWTVAAASILAKNAQVDHMKKLHGKFPEYNFGQHNGYGTAAHYEAIKKHGFHEEHRKSWIKEEKIQ